MCCQAQAIDQQPLKTAQFYVISWKSEGLSDIDTEHRRALCPHLPGRSLSDFITEILLIHNFPVIIFYVFVFIHHLKLQPSGQAGEKY